MDESYEISVTLLDGTKKRLFTVSGPGFDAALRTAPLQLGNHLEWLGIPEEDVVSLTLACSSREFLPKGANGEAL